MRAVERALRTINGPAFMLTSFGSLKSLKISTFSSLPFHVLGIEASPVTTLHAQSIHMNQTTPHPNNLEHNEPFHLIGVVLILGRDQYPYYTRKTVSAKK